MRRAIDGIRAGSEALFPANDLGAPDWRETEMVPRARAYLGELPPPKRRQVTLLFIVLELVGGLLSLRPRRFSRVAAQRRTAAMQRWRVSKIYLLRVLGDAVKAALTMVYMSHASVVAHIGIYKVCENPDDPFPVPIRPNPLLAEPKP
jgi:hypothetical protein